MNIDPTVQASIDQRRRERMIKWLNHNEPGWTQAELEAVMMAETMEKEALIEMDEKYGGAASYVMYCQNREFGRE